MPNLFSKVIQIISHQHVDHLPTAEINTFGNHTKDWYTLGPIDDYFNGDRFQISNSKFKRKSAEGKDEGYVKDGDVEIENYDIRTFKLEHTRPNKISNSYLIKSGNDVFGFISDGNWDSDSLKKLKSAMGDFQAKEAYLLVTTRGIPRETAAVESVHGGLDKLSKAYQQIYEGGVENTQFKVGHMSYEEILTLNDLGTTGVEAKGKIREYLKDKNIRVDYRSITNKSFAYDLFDLFSVIKLAEVLEPDGDVKIKTTKGGSFTRYDISSESGKSVSIERVLGPSWYTKEKRHDVGINTYSPFQYCAKC